MTGGTKLAMFARKRLILKKGVCGSAREYKVEIIAFDETTTITLLLWDNEVVSLLGVKAQNVYDNLLTNQVANDDGYPSILDDLVERKLVFRINVKAENISGKDTIFT
ncbi:hypothetical protein PIB30_033613, partial [Stylosanthes scabra]|nr:hypothetical protein [Stylosanthes scabra]